MLEAEAVRAAALRAYAAMDGGRGDGLKWLPRVLGSN